MTTDKIVALYNPSVHGPRCALPTVATELAGHAIFRMIINYGLYSDRPRVTWDAVLFFECDVPCDSP